MTGGAIIYAAFRLLKIVRFPQQTASPDQVADGLIFLNNLVDSWSTQRILVPVVGFNSFALVASTASYAIGTGATFNTPRPVRIDSAGIVQASYNSGTVAIRTPLKIISEKEWAEIVDKNSLADVPEKLYYAPWIPGSLEGMLYLWPTPRVTSSTKLELSTWTPLSSFPDGTTDVPIPTGYARALIYNLAVELEPAMEGATLDAADAKTAQESKTYIMQLNSEMVPQVPDGAIPPATSAPFEPVPATLKAVAQAKFGGGAGAPQQ